MKANPLITTITPIFNRVEMIRDCIQSVKNQDYPFIEHVIIDGGSTDGTVDILKEEGVKFISEPDAGIYDAFNKGIRQANGEIIHILNSDDYFAFNTVIKKVVAVFNSTKCDLVHARVAQIDKNSNIIWAIGGHHTKRQLLRKMKIAHPSVFIKKEIYHQYGEFSIGFKIAGDYEFLLRIWDKVRIEYIPEILIFMRMGGSSTGNVIQSYRESFAASLLHGQTPTEGIFIYFLELIKHYCLVIPLRKLRYRKK